MKTILRILLSALVAAGTTMFLMLRYSDIELSEVVAEVRSAQPKNDIGTVASSSQMTTPAERASSPTHSPLRMESRKQRYLDYDKLSSDIESISSTLERFNDMLGEQVDKLKGGSSAKKTEALDGT